MVDHLCEQYADAILTSNPNDPATREQYFYLHHALQNLVSQLGVYSAEAKAIVDEGQQEDAD